MKPLAGGIWRGLWRDVWLGLRCAGFYMVGHVRADGMLRDDEGFVRHSFVAALLCLPVLALVRVVDWRSGPHPAVLWHAASVTLLLYAAGWAGFLLLARAALGALGLVAGWPRLVAAWNWCSVAQYAVLLLANLLSLAGAGLFVLQVALIVTVAWQGWIEFHALRPVLVRAGMAGVAWGPNRAPQGGAETGALRRARAIRSGMMRTRSPGPAGLALALTVLDFVVGLAVQTATISLGG